MPKAEFDRLDDVSLGGAGIPYLTLADEERVRSVMAEKLKQAATPTHNHIPSIPAEQKEFMESTM